MDNQFILTYLSEDVEVQAAMILEKICLVLRMAGLNESYILDKNIAKPL